MFRIRFISYTLKPIVNKKSFTWSKIRLKLFRCIWSFLNWPQLQQFISFITVPVDLSPEERSELEDIRRRKGVLLQEIQRLREELREAILEVEGLEASTEGR